MSSMTRCRDNFDACNFKVAIVHSTKIHYAFFVEEKPPEDAHRKKLATAAVNGELKPLLAIFELLSGSGFSRADLLAPVFFYLLDPSYIPSLDFLALHLNPAVDSPLLRVHRAIISLKALSIRNPTGGGLILAKGASPELWPRVWSWIQFLHRCHDDLAHLNPFNEEELDLDELVQGAGGSSMDLARLLVEHLRFLIPSPEDPITNEILVLLCSVIRLLKTTRSSDAAWETELLCAGIIKAVVYTLVTLTVSRRRHYGGDERLLRLPSEASQRHSSASPLDHGLTPIHAVLLRTEDARRPASWSQISRRGFSSELLPLWKTFMDVARPRLELMKHYHKRDLRRGRNCDNMEQAPTDIETKSMCALRKLHLLFEGMPERRLARGRPPQGVCALPSAAPHSHALLGLLLLAGDPESLSPRDRSFLRALAHQDYFTHKAYLDIGRIRFMNGTPGKMFVSVLDYTAGAVESSVRSVRAMNPTIQSASFRALWDEAVKRAHRSRGRIHLVVLLVAEGDLSTRYRLLAMHSETSAIQDEMESIASSLPQGVDIEHSEQLPEIGRRVGALLKQDGCRTKLIW
ncbi:hypothetical protein FB451DRAFT_1164541 [Mycena latifolia]|nr:hypothetical protein FB451DRAFT_1164541 [Mycena latifolia]